jgi:predicted nucleic acid-binding protein
MRTVFADTVYWLAITKPDDQWSEVAKEVRASLGEVRLITTDEVLTEFLTGLASGGEYLRRQAAKMIKAIMESPNVKVLPQTRDSFLRGVKLYGERADKRYSLTDCISMNAMNAESLSEILTIDKHFEQEKFIVLMKRP